MEVRHLKKKKIRQEINRAEIHGPVGSNAYKERTRKVIKTIANKVENPVTEERAQHSRKKLIYCPTRAKRAEG